MTISREKRNVMKRYRLEGPRNGDPEWAVIEVHKGYLCFCLRSEDAQRIVDALNRIEES
jgi:hypothetical protein